jgi:hypothetical protein
MNWAQVWNDVTQILPDLQSSGTLKLTFEFAGAVQLIIRTVSDGHYLEQGEFTRWDD